MEDVILKGDSEDISKLMAALRELRGELTGIQETLAPIKEELGKIDQIKEEAKAEYLAKVSAIAEREQELKSKRNEANNLVRKITNQVNSAERNLQQAMRIERLRAEQADIDKRLDDAMVMAKWFSQIMTHQFEAAKKIVHRQRMILADAPGLGKTLTALATADLIKEATVNARPDNPYNFDLENYNLGVTHQCGFKILYVCPAPLVKNVVREIGLWTDRSPVMLGGQPRATRNFLIEMMNESKEFIAVVNYEAWRRDKNFLDDLGKLQFDFIILDEAHVLKDRKTGAYNSIRWLLSANRELPDVQLSEMENVPVYKVDRRSNKYTPFVLAMTGTPILNKPHDLFALLSLIDPDHFVVENYFLNDYCTQDLYTKKWQFRSGGLDSLAKRIANIYLRRTKRDAGITLPGKHEQIHELTVDKEMYPDQARVREEMRKWGAIMLTADKAITAAAEIAIYTRLRQIETWPAGIELKDSTGDVILHVDVEESQKIDYLIRTEDSSEDYSGLLADLCDGGLREGNSVVVFSQFKAPLRELLKRCTSAGISAVVLDGDTPESQRDEIIRDFDRRYTQDDKARWQVVLANYRVGGVGVTLTRATEVIMLDSEWSAGREEQAMDRVHRIGQTEDVTIHKILMENTIDSWLDAIVSHKRNLTEGFNEVFDFSELKKKIVEG